MDQQTMKQNDGMEVDFRQLLDVLMHKLWLVVLVSLLGAVLTLAISAFCITPKYESSAMFYVNNNSLSVGNTSLSISSGDLSTSRNLVESYLVILNTWETLADVTDYAGVDRTVNALSEMITAEAVNETEIFKVTVTSPDPQEAEALANAIAYILPKRINTIIEGTSAKIVSSALLPAEPSSPNLTVNTVIGFLLGFVLIVGIITLREIFDITIRREEDLAQMTKLPILASIPDMMNPGKDRVYYNSQGEKKKLRRNQAEMDMVGEDIPFAAAEAYKLLRTKIQYSFSDDNACHVIGVSSALSGEGKSTTSVNLAYALAQLNKNVLLVDCDLRRPSIAAKLKLPKEHGLSGYLTQQSSIEQAAWKCQIKNGATFMVVPAGQIPPNPTELLSSGRMERFMEHFAGNFDYVILDLPPVVEVSDALVAAKLADGVLLTVRQDYCNRIALDDTIKQFEFVNGRILGLLLTCTTEHGAGYGKSYYKRYYSRYGKYRQYARSYEESCMEQTQKQ